MSIAVLNRWLTDMMDKADALAALDRIIIPRAIPPGEFMQLKADVTNNRNPACFQNMTADDKRKARPDNVPVELWNVLLESTFANKDGLFHNMSAMWTVAGVFKDGPKLYCPTLEEFDGLARVELGVPLSAYRQPFPTTIISVPFGAFPAPVSDSLGRPAFVVVRHFCGADDNGSGGLIDGLVIGDVAQRDKHIELNFRIAWSDDGAELLETRLQKIREVTFDFSGLNERCGRLADGEVEAMEVLKRVTLNACLLLSQQTPRLIGKTNPAHAAKLIAKRAKKLPAHVVAANEKQLRLMPTVYGFQQHIRVVERVKEENANPTGSCPPKKPHWRRGFWRNQSCGEGHRERVLRFIPATLVNEHLLCGPLHNTRVTMTTR